MTCSICFFVPIKKINFSETDFIFVHFKRVKFSRIFQFVQTYPALEKFGSFASFGFAGGIERLAKVPNKRGLFFQKTKNVRWVVLNFCLCLFCTALNAS